jgi:CBS domain-containing protein
MSTATRTRLPRASDLMSREVVTIRRGTSVRDAAAILTDHMISGAPVVDDDNRVLGVISASNIAAACGAPPDEPSPKEAYMRYLWLEDEAGDGAASHRVEDVMMPVAFTVTPDASVLEIVHTMTTARIHRVLVVENERLAGIVTSMDVVGAVPGLLRRSPEKMELDAGT